MRQFHITIILAVWVIVGALLALQFFLNALKYQELVIAATSDRMQVTADVLESSIIRAEQIGLRIDEIDSLDVLIERKLQQAPLIDDIRILDQNGEVIAGTDLVPLDDGTRGDIVRRILAREDAVTAQEVDGQLYSSRLVYDSSSSIMGIILISIDRSVYAPSVASVRMQLGQGFLGVFVLVAALVVPFVLFGFRRVTRAIDFVEARIVGGEADVARFDRSDRDLAELDRTIDDGNAAFDALSAEIEEVAGSKAGTG